MKDNEIIELYWERNETAITATAEKYGGYFHTISYNILHNNEDAEECVNDTWLGAWKSMPPQRPNRLATYLGKITRNLSLDRFKQYNAAKRGSGQAELVLTVDLLEFEQRTLTNNLSYNIMDCKQVHLLLGKPATGESCLRRQRKKIRKRFPRFCGKCWRSAG